MWLAEANGKLFFKNRKSALKVFLDVKIMSVSFITYFKSSFVTKWRAFSEFEKRGLRMWPTLYVDFSMVVSYRQYPSESCPFWQVASCMHMTHIGWWGLSTHALALSTFKTFPARLAGDLNFNLGFDTN